MISPESFLVYSLPFYEKAVDPDGGSVVVAAAIVVVVVAATAAGAPGAAAVSVQV